MSRASLLIPVVLAVWVGVGCRSRWESPRGASATPQPRMESAPPAETRTSSPGFVASRDAGSTGPALETEDGTVEQEAERDLAIELQRAVGAPTDCLNDFRANGPRTIQIPIRARVRPSGAVIQPTVGGSGVSEAARECIARRVEAVRLEPLEEPLSQVVSTWVRIDYTPSVVVESEGEASLQLRNVKDPLPKRPEVAPSGFPIQEPTSRPIDPPTSREPTGPMGRRLRGPKPRPIDGYGVDENAQEWR